VLDGPVKHELFDFVHEFARQIHPFMVVAQLSESRGLAFALNHGLSLCSHEFIARMDSDDISLPSRFFKQMAFMEGHPDISASSAFVEEFDENGKILGVRKLPITSEAAFKFAKYRCPLSHPASIFRKSVVLSLGGYPEIYPEDHALWSLMLNNGLKLTNLGEVLLRMRLNSNFLNRRGVRLFRGELGLIRFQRRIHFLTYFESILNIMLRIITRLSPTIIKIWLYRWSRA
jgi:glycosyltransferase involved in cell wall biosynthesis